MPVSINPASGTAIAHYEPTTPERIDEVLRQAMVAQITWRMLDFHERAGPLQAAARILRDEAESFGRLMAQEMGKPISQGIGEANKSAWVCDHYATNAASYLADEEVATEARSSRIVCRPLGTILAVMPWNFPFWQVFRCAAPVLMAGNAVLLKHASNVPGCSEAIVDIFTRAGLPAGLFEHLLISGSEVAELIARPEISGVTLTGSTPAGRAVGAAAGQAIKPSVLELGGSDPYVVLADADIQRAAEICVRARLLNTGQTCIAAKRFIVEQAVARPFLEAVVQHMAEAVMGDPLVDSTTVGPMARPDLRDELHQQVLASMAAGAHLLLGGTVPPGPGAYYPPTVLADVTPGMPAFDEELFGPVAAITVAQDEADAIALANQTPFGLGAALFTRDLTKAQRIATMELHAGCVFVNDHVKSDPRLPFGGIKASGYGRELAAAGIRAFVNVKTVVIEE